MSRSSHGVFCNKKTLFSVFLGDFLNGKRAILIQFGDSLLPYEINQTYDVFDMNNCTR